MNEHLIRAGGLDIAARPGRRATSSRRRAGSTGRCRFPKTIDAGLRVAKLGTTSVVYEIGLFRQGDDVAAAQGRFVHVWVDRATQRPARVPDKIRRALAPLLDRTE